jgi:translocation protein SEC63
MKVTDVPFSQPYEDRDYRLYKLQFQAPQTTGLFTWKIYLVSDTFLGEEVTRDIVVRSSLAFVFVALGLRLTLGVQLKIDDVSALNADERQSEDDDISEPDEDTLAGQMAAMRGGKVKRRDDGEEGESEEESSGTDDDKDSDSSDSDSD